MTEKKHDLKLWFNLWENQDIPFHRDTVNNHLIRYWNKLNTDDESVFLIPLCGKSLDITWIAEQTKKVIGIELVPLAIEQYYQSLNITPIQQKIEGYHIWSAENSNTMVIQEDIFDLKPKTAYEATHFYDIASLVAIDPQKHRDYVDTLLRISPNLQQGLLISISYDQNLAKGPPFSLTPLEIENLFSDHFEIILLEENQAERSPTNLANINPPPEIKIYAFLLIRKQVNISQ